jgi:hypothetical protein
MLNLFQHLIKSMDYETLKQVQDDKTDLWNGLINSLKIITTLICKIPPALPFPKGSRKPSGLFVKEGRGKILE